MAKKSEVVDASKMKACQLVPNDDFLSEADFLDPNGNYRNISATIERVTIEELQSPGRSDTKKCPIISFAGKRKRFVCRAKVNRQAIITHYGKNVSDWLNKPLPMYYDPSVMFGRDRVGGIRVQPHKDFDFDSKRKSFIRRDK